MSDPTEAGDVRIRIGSDYDGDAKERALVLATCTVVKLIREIEPTEAGRHKLAGAYARTISDMVNDMTWSP